MFYDDPRLRDFLTQLSHSHPLTPVVAAAPETSGNLAEIVGTAERAAEIWVSLICNAQHHIHSQTLMQYAISSSRSFKVFLPDTENKSIPL